MTRERGVRVTVMLRSDVDQFPAMPQKLRDKLADFGDVAIARGINGVDYYLCSEGVGWIADERHIGWQAPDVDGVDSIDLADYIREFGSRLESNFYMWHRYLTEAK